MRPLIAGALSLLVTCCASSSLAQTGPAPSAGQRQVRVTSDPSPVRVGVDRRQGGGRAWLRTPMTLQLSPEGHTLTLRRASFETARVSIPAGGEDLRLHVEMSRPVFEAGVFLTVLGAIALGPAIGFAANGYIEAAAPFLGLSVATIVPGILMIVLDHNRSPVIDLTPELPGGPRAQVAAQEPVAPPAPARTPAQLQLLGRRLFWSGVGLLAAGVATLAVGAGIVPLWSEECELDPVYDVPMCYQGPADYASIALFAVGGTVLAAGIAFMPVGSWLRRRGRLAARASASSWGGGLSLAIAPSAEGGLALGLSGTFL